MVATVVVKVVMVVGVEVATAAVVLNQQRVIDPIAGRDRRPRRAAYGNRHPPRCSFGLSDRRWTDGDCHDEPTDDVIMSMTSRRRCQYTFFSFCFKSYCTQ